ncbi:unnamed protein product [Cuscuta campestris]|uniref:NOSIC domain-containing protein n=1 Tax=Cuscuta campestris TaxID=132261 RepID=A0A484N1F1_9ASTE|nr:unnamed protein product [Cuscuta campestris]
MTNSPKAIIGVFTKSPALAILNIRHRADKYTWGLLKGIRINFERYMGLNPGDLEKAQRSLARSYSSAKEWFGRHFPELVKLVDNGYLYARVVKVIEDIDNGYLYARVVKVIEDKSMLTDNHISTLADILGDEDKAKAFVEATKASMGRTYLVPIYFYV